MSTSRSDRPENQTSTLRRRHMQAGWIGFTLFAIVGLTLEALHAFKIASYLGHDTETRRLMWTLAHAHGALIALVHLAFAAHVDTLPLSGRERAWTSGLLLASLVLLPGGFAAGGLFLHGPDPGVGVLLAPLGAIALVGAGALCARASLRAS